MSSTEAISSFSGLALPAPLQQALVEVGYETPSPIQARIIPHVLEGADVLGQAQTGTGKTAAFALPVLARLDLQLKPPQALVLVPTRELAIQVAEAFQKYARHLPGFQVLPLYGGSDYRGQLRQLQRGVQVVVGTPGRVMDHMRRGSLDVSGLRTLVLDEADEMLRMGFIDDVEWVLEQTPPERQIALFSATMPDAIRRIARRHLREPREVAIEVRKVTTALIRQRVWMVAGLHKLDALTRILEVEEYDGILIFVRTRIQAVELADKLAARGHSVAALNGDIPQKQREQTVDKLKSGALDIVVATDVAARGLDVQRISHVINYDIPADVEAYIHRIGRTGRAGRQGDAILFVASRERRLLAAIEKATGNSIERMTLPTAEEISGKRVDRFKARIAQALASDDIDFFRQLVLDYQHEHGVPVLEIAAALGALAQGKEPLRAAPRIPGRSVKDDADAGSMPTTGRRKRAVDGADDAHRAAARAKPRGQKARHNESMQRFRLEVGALHGVKPGNIVGAIANEADIDSEYIGRIEIFDDHSTIELPEGMPDEIFRHLQSVWVSGQRLRISRLAAEPDTEVAHRGRHKPDSGRSDAAATRRRPAPGKPSAGKAAPKKGARRPTK